MNEKDKMGLSGGGIELDSLLDNLNSMETTLTRLCEITEERASTHENSFCYGILEVSEKDNYTVAEVIEKADQRMYCQKREYHIRKAQEKRDKYDIPDLFAGFITNLGCNTRG